MISVIGGYDSWRFKSDATLSEYVSRYRFDKNELLRQYAHAACLELIRRHEERLEIGLEKI